MDSRPRLLGGRLFAGMTVWMSASVESTPARGWHRTYNEASVAPGPATWEDTALSRAGTGGSTAWRGADSLVRAMGSGGVERAFALSGNQIMSVFDAAIDSGVELVHVRHEAAAVHMADAFGRLTGRPGVALVTAGPGFANTLSALYVARMAESPLVLLSGRAPHRDNAGAFQQMAQADMARPVAKASWTLAEGADPGLELARAFRIAASGRPGPVHLALPVDLLEGDAPSPAGVAGPGDFRPADPPADGPAVGAVLDALLEAGRPLVLAGPALTRGRARDVLGGLAARSGLPVVSMESPRGTGDPSLGALADVLPEADTVLLLGKKLDFSLKMGRAPAFGSGCRFLQIDADETEIELTRRILAPSGPDAAVVGGPVEAAASMLAALHGRRFADSDWGREVEAAVAYRPASWDSVEAAEGEPLHPLQAARALRDAMSDHDDPVFVSDGGEFGQWAQAAVQARSRVINGPSGAIGGGVPFALGARAARPDSTVFLTIGDGSFGYHAMEIDTALRSGLPFVALVGNDAAWNAEYQIQLREYGEDRLYGCELLPTRYDRLVEALGGHGEHVTSAEQLRPALERAAASGRPACVNVEIQRAGAPAVSRRSPA